MVNAVTVATVTRAGRVCSGTMPPPTAMVHRMKDSSPIWPSASPENTLRRSELPDPRLATVTDTNCIVITTPQSSSASGRVVVATRGSTVIPIDTKNRAEKNARSGSISFSTSWPRPDSATAMPARKAPRATE